MKTRFIILLALLLSSTAFSQVTVTPGYGRPWINPKAGEYPKLDDDVISQIIKSIKQTKFTTQDTYIVEVAAVSTQYHAHWGVLLNITIKKVAPLQVHELVKINGKAQRTADGKLMKKRVTRMLPTNLAVKNFESGLKTDKQLVVNEVANAARQFVSNVINGNQKKFNYWGVFSARQRNIKHFLCHFLNQLSHSEARDKIIRSKTSVYGRQRFSFSNNKLVVRITWTLYRNGQHVSLGTLTGRVLDPIENFGSLDRAHRHLLVQLANVAASELTQFFQNRDLETIAAHFKHRK